MSKFPPRNVLGTTRRAPFVLPGPVLAEASQCAAELWCQLSEPACADDIKLSPSCFLTSWLEFLLGEPPLNLNFSAILVNCVSEFFYSWMSSILVYSVDLTVFEFVFSVSFWELEIADNILYTRWFGFFRLISSGDLRYFFCVCELGNNTYYSFIFPLFQSPSLEFIYFVLFPCIHFRICSWIFFFSPHLLELGLLLFLLLLFVLEQRGTLK